MPTQSIHVGDIPDIAKAPLYLSVVQDLARTPDQLVLWCAIAIYDPYDCARGQMGSAVEWLDRTGLPPDRLTDAWQGLVARGLVTRDGIPHTLLWLASIDRAKPYTDKLRAAQRQAVDAARMTQAVLFQE